MFYNSAEGVSTNPCSDLYCGSSPASEPETQAVQAELTKIKDNLLALVTVHAYGNMYMHPWGNTIDGWFCERAADHDDMVIYNNHIVTNELTAIYI